MIIPEIKMNLCLGNISSERRSFRHRVSNERCLASTVDFSLLSRRMGPCGSMFSTCLSIFPDRFNYRCGKLRLTTVHMSRNVCQHVSATAFETTQLPIMHIRRPLSSPKVHQLNLLLRAPHTQPVVDRLGSPPPPLPLLSFVQLRIPRGQ